jgi:IPT/TIG domain
MSVLAHSGSKNQYSTHSSLRAACLKGERKPEAALPYGVLLLADGACEQPVADELGAEGAAADELRPSARVASGPSRPRVAYVDHRSGPASGGTSVTILGSYFAGVTEVLFGDAQATSFKVVSGNRIVAVAPPHDAGVVDVVVAAAGGRSAAVKAHQFTYVADPVITQLKADHGPTRGGTLVVVHGGNFVAGQTRVTFGKRPGKDVKVLSNRLLVVKTPPSETGVVPVAVTTTDGASNEVPFVYE